MMQNVNAIPAPGAVPPVNAAPIRLRVKDPGSALTHFIGFCAAVLATPPLLVRAGALDVSLPGLVSLSVFMLSMVLLYAASTTYHTLDINPKVNKRLKKIDHMMIFVLIAGTYTPYCTLVLREAAGRRLLITIWTIAAVGLVLKACWVTCPKWFSSVIYIAMGWVCIAYAPGIYNGASHGVFWWLLAGGVLYTVGGVIYALKLKVFNSKWRYFGSHELFHVFVMAGSLCHYISILCCIG